MEKGVIELRVLGGNGPGFTAGKWSMRKPSLNVLVLSDFGGYDANVVRDYLYCFNQHSRHQYFYLHRWARDGFRRLLNFDFDRFDAIILFWDFFWIGADNPLSYCHVPPSVSERIANSRALKIQFLQDEYRDVRLANRVMNRFGANLMFSCVQPKDHAIFYPQQLIPSLKAVYPVLTGYVPTYLERVSHVNPGERTIDIGYRSRRLPYYLGRLGQEKSVIAERFQGIADQYGFSADISVREQDRIYGDAWLSFMRACRFSIGTESGASVVDFDGQIRRQCQEFLRQDPTATFEETEKAVFPDLDGRVVVQTISPRIFEAAAFENTLVLHQGHYEGMLQADVHYIAVKKDYSNVLEVVERMKDRTFCERLAENTKTALISRGEYSYRSFVKRFDEILETHAPEKDRQRHLSRTVFYFLNYVNNDALIPHDGVCLTIPHACDPVHQFNSKAPHLLVVVYSIVMILACVAKSPRVMADLILRLLRFGPQDGSPIGLIKDLRIFALLAHLRRGDRAKSCPPFCLQFEKAHDPAQLIVRTVPISASDAQREPSVAVEDSVIVDAVLDSETPFAIKWENRSMGDALPLPFEIARDGKIYLNADCEYRFEYMNRVSMALSTAEKQILRQLLLGDWTGSSWLAKVSAVACMAWSIARYSVGRIAKSLCKPLLAKIRIATRREERTRELVR